MYPRGGQDGEEGHPVRLLVVGPAHLLQFPTLLLMFRWDISHVLQPYLEGELMIKSDHSELAPQDPDAVGHLTSLGRISILQLLVSASVL